MKSIVRRTKFKRLEKAICYNCRGKSKGYTTSRWIYAESSGVIFSFCFSLLLSGWPSFSVNPLYEMSAHILQASSLALKCNYATASPFKQFFMKTCRVFFGNSVLLSLLFSVISTSGNQIGSPNLLHSSRFALYISGHIAKPAVSYMAFY